MSAPTPTEIQRPAHRYPVLIRESHLDTFGHVNNATYLVLFEEARWELITEGGFGKAEIEKRRQGPVILGATIEYRREVTNRERLTIETTLVDYKSRVGHLRQVALKEQGELACEAVFTFGLWDLDARKLIKPTPEWLLAIQPRP